MSSEALAHLRVLDLSRLLPGGLCTLVLADLGADVVKIEHPAGGDYARARAPFLEGAREPTSASASFRGLNRNKRSLALDLKQPEGRAALMTLVADADVVVESFRPGVMERLGLGYPELAAANPRIIMCRISGWGQTGPKAHAAGHDLSYLAEMGLLSHTAHVDDVPHIPPMQVADSAAGLYAVVGVLAALQERTLSGRGQELDVSIAHSALPFAAMTIAATLATGRAQPTDAGVWTGGALCYQVYRCSDGWIALAALEEKFWAAFCVGVGRADLLPSRYDRPGSPAHAEVVALMAARTRAEWAEFAAEHDCCLSVVAGLDEALASPLVAPALTPELVDRGEAAYRAVGFPVGMSRTPARYDRLPTPGLDADAGLVAWSPGTP